MLTGADEIEAADDVAASRLVEARERPETVEIWREGRRIQTILPVRASAPRALS